MNQHNDKHWEIKTQNNGFRRSAKTPHTFRSSLFSGRSSNPQNCPQLFGSKTFLFTDISTRRGQEHPFCLFERMGKERSLFFISTSSGAFCSPLSSEPTKRGRRNWNFSNTLKEAAPWGTAAFYRALYSIIVVIISESLRGWAGKKTIQKITTGNEAISRIQMILHLDWLHKILLVNDEIFNTENNVMMVKILYLKI